MINVLKGDMSFVGPRPESAKYREYYVGPRAEILDVRPGITDPASIKYRHEEELLAKSADPEGYYRDVILPDKLQKNLNYVRDGVGFWKDVSIIGKTLAEILNFKGAR